MPTFICQRIASSAAPQNPSSSKIEKGLAKAWALIPKRPKERHTHFAIDLMLVTDEEIAEYNWAHMQHQGPTDVLSFPMLDYDPERNAFFLGEIIVSFETAQREAKARGLTEQEELLRYIIHGFLHLLGYDDQNQTAHKEMHELQEKILKTTFNDY